MELTKLNQWLSVIANLGVLAGIVFFAFELQQNSSLARAGAFQQLMNSEIMQLVFASPTMSKFGIGGT